MEECSHLGLDDYASKLRDILLRRIAETEDARSGRPVHPVRLGVPTKISAWHRAREQGATRQLIAFSKVEHSSSTLIVTPLYVRAKRHFREIHDEIVAVSAPSAAIEGGSERGSILHCDRGH